MLAFIDDSGRDDEMRRPDVALHRLDSVRDQVDQYFLNLNLFNYDWRKGTRNLYITWNFISRRALLNKSYRFADDLRWPCVLLLERLLFEKRPNVLHPLVGNAPAAQHSLYGSHGFTDIRR